MESLQTQSLQMQDLELNGGRIIRVVEAGHHFTSIGTTEWTQKGWEIMQSLREGGDTVLLYRDDVLSASQAPIQEIQAAKAFPEMLPAIVIDESKLLEWEDYELDLALTELKAAGASKGKNGRWYFEEILLVNERKIPTTVMSDYILTVYKYRLGAYNQGLNILPYFYAKEQEKLLRIISSALPDFTLKVILFDLHDFVWQMN